MRQTQPITWRDDIAAALFVGGLLLTLLASGASGEPAGPERPILWHAAPYFGLQLLDQGITEYGIAHRGLSEANPIAPTPTKRLLLGVVSVGALTLIDRELYRGDKTAWRWYRRVTVGLKLGVVGNNFRLVVRW